MNKGTEVSYRVNGETQLLSLNSFPEIESEEGFLFVLDILTKEAELLRKHWHIIDGGVYIDVTYPSGASFTVVCSVYSVAPCHSAGSNDRISVTFSIK